jgi:enamine deaminase RidA (YjgF/YER057c/UK114 family)/ribosomal protein S18 acetylase RimI-like enzyme
MEIQEQGRMKRTFSGVPWESKVGYCRALRVGNTIAVTGTAAVKEGRIVGVGDAYLQAKTCLEIIEEAISQLGATRRNIIRTRLFVTDISKWQDYGRAHGEFFTGHPPTTSMIEIKSLIDPQMLIEIEADAIIPTIDLRVVSPFASDVQNLISQLNEHNLAHYSADVCHLDPPETLAKENCTMLGAYDGGILCGIGAVKFFADYGEIKRMFVPKSYRGQGISHQILNRLINLIKDRNLPYARLETGDKYKAALHLYEKKGFKPRKAFGDYIDTEDNLYMELAL